MSPLNEFTSDDAALLIRIDERTRVLAEDVKLLRTNFVRKEEFDPIKKIVYGMVSLVLISVLGGAISIILK